jgi:sugar transport system substrate-binding protein
MHLDFAAVQIQPWPRIMKLKLLALTLTLSAAAVAQAAEPVGSRPPKIATIIFQEDQFFRLIEFGAREAAQKAGAISVEGNSENKLDKEKQLVDAFIAGKADAMVISPLSRKASVETVKRAKARGVAVVTYNTTVDGDLADAFVECDQSDLGRQSGAAAARYIREKLGGKAKVAILAFNSLVPEQSGARVGGFKEALKDLPGVRIVAEQDAWLAEMAVKRAGDILTANPDVDLIWAANEGGTAGAVLAVKNSGRAGKVAVFGTDISEQMLGFLKSPDNILQATTAQRPYEVGVKAAETALKVIRKEPVEKKVVLPGLCLRRGQPEEIADYEQHLKEWMGKGR